MVILKLFIPLLVEKILVIEFSSHTTHYYWLLVSYCFVLPLGKKYAPCGAHF